MQLRSLGSTGIDISVLGLGTVKLGTNLELALFDQSRAQLDADMSLWDSLTGDPEMRVSGKADQVMVRGQPKHVVGYLKEFLFDEAQARAPVRSLSGGEKALTAIALVFAIFLGPEPEFSFATGAGLAAGLFWVASSLGINYLFSQRSLTLLLVDGGYHTARFTLYGMIQGLWL